MTSLSDRIDQLATTAKAIRASAAAIVPSGDNPAPTAIPFTRAVLDTALGDLIRDIDASELGLFTLVPPLDVRKQPDDGARRGEISRVEFLGATPLRKQPARREDMFKPKEYEPEVYAHAALKYLDRYQSIRRMPRARSQAVAIVEQLQEARDNIKRLNEVLQELTSAGATSEPTPQINSFAEEERQITDLQNRLAELRSQKEAILRSNEPKQASGPKAALKSAPKRSLSPSLDSESHEDAFWSTPATSGRTLRFTDRLLEEEPDFAALSATSFDSPGPAPPKSVFARLASSPTKKGSNTLSEGNMFGGPEAHEGEDEDAEEDMDEQSSLLDVSLDPEHDPGASVLNAQDDEDEENLDEDTIILPKAPLQESDNLLPSSSVDSQPQTIPATTGAQPSIRSSSGTNNVHITPKLECLAARIWSTVGDILLPGTGGEKPPRAKETLALIESMATRSPSPSSPASSISSITSATAGPTHHQVNTAQLLHTLLTAPNHSMPLNQLKAAIGSTRALYACVAKKLIRIDRGGGEQIVVFDAGV